MEVTTMDALNKWGARAFNNAYLYYSEMAKSENENVFMIFDDWWHGESVYSAEYMGKCTEEDHDMADGIIMTAISNGFG
ncbi:hypothetical protein ACW5UC_24775 [Priestia aryabhattai]|uniref:hypothetical protein n=1 Tax=Priestia megaterium TaxID=1404 RepID=UPI003F9A63A0